jgi:hypothetical protein
MLEPMPFDTVVVQGPIRLADAWCCLDCEVLFTSLERCPRCAGSAIWPVAAWVSPALPHLASPPPRRVVPGDHACQNPYYAIRPADGE